MNRLGVQNAQGIRIAWRDRVVKKEAKLSKQIEKAIEQLTAQTILEQGYELIDVEMNKLGGATELVLYIDGENGVDLDACEKVSRAIDPIIEKADLIPNSYMLCVSSPGIERTLKRPRDFEKNMGQMVRVKLFAAFQGKKEFVGTLSSYDEKTGSLTLDMGDDTEMVFEKQEIAIIKLYAEF